MSKLSSQEIESIADAVVRASDPSMVILFGSRAKGLGREDSDIDLIVVGDRPNVEHWSRRKTVGNIRRNLRFSNLPFDILFFTPDEVSRWRNTTNHVISDALANGSVIYERP